METKQRVMTKHMPVQTPNQPSAWTPSPGGPQKGTRAAIFQLWAEKGHSREIPKDPSLFHALPETRQDKRKPLRLARLCEDMIQADGFEFWD